MRTKEELLFTFDKLLNKGANDKEIALSVAYQFLEVFIDIRDVLIDGLDDIHGAINNISLIR